MTSRMRWMWVLVAAGMVVSAGLKAEEGGGKKESSDTAKAEAQKKHEAEKAEMRKKRDAEEMKKRLEDVKKQVAERESSMEKMTKMMAEKKDEDMKPYLEKQIDFNKKQIDLLKQLQTALEGQNREQAEKIHAQIKDLSSAWNGVGEQTARMDAERAKMKKLMGDNPTPEMKAALDAYNASSDAILKAVEKRQALEKEIKELYMKQREAMEKLYKESQAAKHKDKGKDKKK